MNLKCQMIYLLICDIAFLIFELELLHITINLVQRYGDWNKNPRIDHQSECHRNEKPYASWRPFYMIGRKIINSWDRNWFLLQLLLVEITTFWIALPEKKHVSSPNLGRYEAHFGEPNSTITVSNETIKGRPYESPTSSLYLLELEGLPL